MAEALFDKADHRRVVEHLRAHITALRPRRHHDHRHARAHAIGAVHIFAGRILAVAQIDLVGGRDSRQAVGARSRCERGRHVIEEAIVLVVVDEQYRLAPHLRVRGQNLQHLIDIPCAVVRGPVRMLGIGFRRDDPRDLRQRIVGHVLLEDIEVSAAVCHVGAGARLVIQRIARRRVAILVEVEQRVVAVVADIRVRRPAPRTGGIQAGAFVLIDLPRNTGVLQYFGVRRPAVAELGVVDHRATAAAVVTHPAGPHVVTVRVRRSQQRAVIRVANRECVGQRVVERNVVARHVRHRRGAFGRHPLVVQATVPCRVRGVPVVRQILQELQAEIRRARTERQHVARVSGDAFGERLIPHRVAGGECDGARVAKAAHAAQRAEVVVECAVFLHQDDDVLDVLDAACGVVSGNRECVANAERQHAQRGCRTRSRGGCAQKITAIF